MVGDNWELLAVQLNLSPVTSAGPAQARGHGLIVLSKDNTCYHNLSQPHQRQGKLSASHQPHQDLTSLSSSRLQGQ